ncbi:DUF302 domain-containing protein [Fluviibacterium sp. DFM31]|uniref:DUF302 domain-containing protein n=1 Tax=Meridianimarinicoccus marinus TaxID=3231483 RepID=A0ABV3L4W0_9RHOB
MRRIALALTLLASPGFADSIAPRDGWAIHASTKTYDQMIDAVKAAAAENQLGVVTQAGPTGAAKARGITIPGNQVIGLFNNVFAVRILGLSTAAMIEAPIRVYVTEEPDGTALLSYKTPSHVFAPYLDEGGTDLAAAAAELDALFAGVAEQALAD